MIKITVSKTWRYREEGSSLTQTYKEGVIYSVPNEVAIAAAKDKACYTPDALALLKSSGQKPAADAAVSKMSKADLAAEVKASREAVAKVAQLQTDLSVVKNELSVTQDLLAISEATAEADKSVLEVRDANEKALIDLFNSQTEAEATDIPSVIAAMQSLDGQDA